MKFKVGDKVKFIDEIGGGIVTKIIDTKLVNIKTDDGFEMPVVSSGLMPDHRANPKEDTISYNAPLPVQIVDDTEPEFISEINPWGNVQEESGVYLAFEPHEKQWLLTGDLDVILVNNTPFELLFSLFLERGNLMQGVDFSSVPANSKIVIETINREEVERWTKGYLQLLFHSDSPDKVYMPVHSVIDIQVSRFFKEGSYRVNTLLDGRAIIVMVITQNTLTIASDNESVRKTDSSIEKVKTKVDDKPLIDKYRTGNLEAVVDLHIGELVDNILGLSSLDMLKIQIDTFKKVLENAIVNNYRKVTFIHGVGNGVLKDAIIKELNEYENLENRMASITKFGVGAIDVVISPID